jgi:hypothetical protein
MSILKRIKTSGLGMYFTNSAMDLIESTEKFRRIETDKSKLVGLSYEQWETGSWKQLLNILELNNVGDEMLFYKFDLNGFEAVFLFNRPGKISDILSSKGNSPILINKMGYDDSRSELLYSHNFHIPERFIYNSPQDFHNYGRRFMVQENIYLLYLVRLNNKFGSTLENLSDVFFHRFSTYEMVTSISDKSRDEWRTIFFEVPAEERNHKSVYERRLYPVPFLLIYNVKDNSYAIKRIGEDLKGDITVKKIDELEVAHARDCPLWTLQRPFGCSLIMS